MKKIILASIETDGHSGSSFFITNNEEEYKNAIRSLLYYEDQLIYNFKYENRKDNVLEQFYDGDLGEMAIYVYSFKAYKEIENKEFYTRTG